MLEKRARGFYAPPNKLGRLTSVYAPKTGGGMSLLDWSTRGFRTKPTFFSGGAGLVGTADEYLRFAQMLVDGGQLQGQRVLGGKTVRLMAGCQVPELMRQPAIADGNGLSPPL